MRVMPVNFMHFVGVALVAILLSSCAATRPAPVMETTQPQTAKPVVVTKPNAKAGDWRPQTYTVQKGDTLYSIALEHGLDYKEMAQLNNIAPPYVIQIGQVLTLKPAEEVVTIAPLKSMPPPRSKPLPAPSFLKTGPKAVKVPYSEQAMLARTEQPAVPESKPVPVQKPVTENKGESPSQATSGMDENSVDWGWPVHGKILNGFNDSTNKGLDIAGKMGQPVQAAASGKVVYSGSGLRGYGKLIIIKHNKAYLSAYAHNNVILVKEGQSVLKGQKIGEMGDSDANQVKLHFEIRQFGKPVDPLKYLPADKS